MLLITDWAPPPVQNAAVAVTALIKCFIFMSHPTGAWSLQPHRPLLPPVMVILLVILPLPVYPGSAEKRWCSVPRVQLSTCASVVAAVEAVPPVLVVMVLLVPLMNSASSPLFLCLSGN